MVYNIKIKRKPVKNSLNTKYMVFFDKKWAFTYTDRGLGSKEIEIMSLVLKELSDGIKEYFVVDNKGRIKKSNK